MKLSEKITQAMLEGQVRDFSDAYQGAMEEVAIWKRRALEAEDLNRKFIAGINGPMHMGEPAQPTPSVPKKIRRVESGFKGMFLREAQAYKQGWNECRAAMIAAAREAKP